MSGFKRCFVLSKDLLALQRLGFLLSSVALFLSFIARLATEKYDILWCAKVQSNT